MMILQAFRFFFEVSIGLADFIIVKIEARAIWVDKIWMHNQFTGQLIILLVDYKLGSSSYLISLSNKFGVIGRYLILFAHEWLLAK